MPAVLLVTRDSGAGGLAERALANVGYEVVSATSADEAIRSLFSVRVDALVVDTSVGQEELESVCRCRWGSQGEVGIVFLASVGMRWLPGSLPLESQRDELVVKPFTAQEIRQAVERVLTAANRPRPCTVRVWDLELDRTTHELRGPGETVTLTPTEFRLIEYLAQRQGSIISSAELLEQVWEFYPGTGSAELVRSHVRNLRAKLRRVAPDRELIQTVPRRGSFQAGCRGFDSHRPLQSLLWIRLETIL